MRVSMSLYTIGYNICIRVLYSTEHTCVFPCLFIQYLSRIQYLYACSLFTFSNTFSLQGAEASSNLRAHAATLSNNVAGDVAALWSEISSLEQHIAGAQRKSFDACRGVTWELSRDGAM
jgi:hypothetical protein